MLLLLMLPLPPLLTELPEPPELELLEPPLLDVSCEAPLEAAKDCADNHLLGVMLPLPWLEWLEWLACAAADDEV
jgi:hypothetical protein